ncbi:MAG TPA: sugar-binding domain-containing protein [Streptosporangiaceae bacterium]|nr:sugar-binding domain-containing protein [Streptosporangiaceae bacterium]
MVPELHAGFAGLAPAELVRAASIARRFFIEGRSKSEIAAEFGLSRFKVARILDEARAAGIVHIEIQLPAGLDASLAHRLRDTLGLRHAIVVDTPEEPEAQLRQHLAHAAAALLREIVTPDDVVGVGYGRTLTLMAEEIDGLAPCPVVQLTGALLGVNTSENSVELVRRISARSGGPCFSMYAPQVLPNASTAASLRQRPEVSEAYRRFGTVTKAVVAIGSWDPPRSQLYDSLPDLQRKSLREEGVLAEVCAVLLDKDGTQVATDFTERCISINGRQLRAIDEVVGVAGGADKADAVRAVLAGGYVNSLVADSSLVTALLAQAGS